MSGLTWSNPPSRAIPVMGSALTQAIRNGVRELAEHYAVLIENHMKTEAPWTDRTAIARQTLTARVEDVTLDMVTIMLRGGTTYFVYLELANAGRFSVIAPTIDIFGPRLWADVRAMLR